MKAMTQSSYWAQLLLVLALLLPLIILFLLPGGALISGAFWFWLLLMVCFWMLWSLLAPASAPQSQAVEPEPRMLATEEQPEAIREVMNVRVAQEEKGVRIFQGPLREPATSAFEKLNRAFSGETVPMIQEDERHGAMIALLPKPVEEATLERPTRPVLHWLLFGLTVLTTTWAGTVHAVMSSGRSDVNLWAEPRWFAQGFLYALGLLAILGVHELGHYFAARYHGIRVTPPYFIPVPFALGTFGAFIQMRSPTQNRRQLFDVAVAGPLAGLVIAIPLLIFGLQSSTAVPAKFVGGRLTIPGEPAASDETAPPVAIGGASAGSSLLLALLAKLTLPDALRYGCVLQLSPVAFAGWLGVFITGLNLLPIGQLDGGHAVRAMFGNRTGSVVSSISMWSLLLLGIFVWRGLLLWALIVFFMAGTPTPPLNDVTPVSTGRRWLGYLTFIILLLIVVPLPHSFWPAVGIHCPYIG